MIMMGKSIRQIWVNDDLGIGDSACVRMLELYSCGKFIYSFKFKILSLEVKLWIVCGSVSCCF